MNKMITLVIGAILLAILISFLISYPVMLLWNAVLVPAIPAIQPVGWLQMWGIVILIKLMFNTSAHMSGKA